MTLALEIEKEKKQSWEAGKAEGKVEVVIDMLKEKMSIDMIARFTKITVDQIKEIGKKNALL
ncbi:MAG: hypothetical protein J6N55_04105 [Anaerovibrio sp.]|uniref:hypothetical protein n=1 Tax=Anaerovibrio sp. TaxID=1872532 RepID=UPI001B000DDD|nr:hypothetical protein [Anaerovibrio sp.]MBO6245448.1 hypothetical protein [Anaerovibrio sp.]